MARLARKVRGTGGEVQGTDEERFVFRGGKVVSPQTGKVKTWDVKVEAGEVTAVGPRLESGRCQEIDCRGMHLAPGFIDLHCHLREPGSEDAETIASGTRAALSGGFTRVCPMPNTEPATDSEALVRFQRHRAEEAGYARVHPVGCCTKGRQGKELAEIAAMKAAGAVAVSDDGKWVEDPQVMRRVLEYCNSLDLPVISHCEMAGLGPGYANESLFSTRLGIKAVPDVAEAAAAARDILLAEFTGARLHVAHVSSGRTVEVIRWAKARGASVTAETCPHYFTLTEASLVGFDTNFRVNPPLRSEADRKAIVEAVVDGTIDCIATDHAPHTRHAKEVEFEAAPPGIIGFETAFPLGYAEFVLSGRLTLAQYISRLTVAPARIIGLREPKIEVGEKAEFVVLDLAAQWTYSPDLVMSRSHNSPFFERQLFGRVTGGMVAGEHFWLLHPA